MAQAKLGAIEDGECRSLDDWQVYVTDQMSKAIYTKTYVEAHSKVTPDNLYQTKDTFDSALVDTKAPVLPLNPDSKCFMPSQQINQRHFGQSG